MARREAVKRLLELVGEPRVSNRRRCRHSRQFRLLPRLLPQPLLPPPAPELVDPDLPCQQVEKRRELGAGAVALPVAVEPDKGLLHQIFRIPINARAQKKVQQGLLMAPDQSLERLALAGTGPQHELGIFVWREGRHGSLSEHHNLIDLSVSRSEQDSLHAPVANARNC